MVPALSAAFAGGRCCQILLTKRFFTPVSLSTFSCFFSAGVVRTPGVSVASNTLIATRHFTAMPTPVLGRNHGDSSTIKSTGTSSLKCNIINRAAMIQLQNHNERSMATSNRKVIDAKNAKRLKIQQKKKKGLPNKKKSPQQVRTF